MGFLTTDPQQLLLLGTLWLPQGTCPSPGECGHEGILPGTEKHPCVQGAPSAPASVSASALGGQGLQLCASPAWNTGSGTESRIGRAGGDLEIALFLIIVKAAEHFSKWNIHGTPIQKADKSSTGETSVGVQS